MKITNNHDISLLLAVWLVDDNYDYEAGANLEKPYLSATTLMRPLKQIVLAQRIPIEEREQEDVEDFIARSLGHTIHDGVERAWKQNYQKNLRRLGYPEAVIEQVAINPTDEERLANPDMIPVYLEQRGYREVEGYVIGGKFDAICDGRVEDVKSTSAYSWVYGTRDDEHILQMSLYNWIDAARPVRWITEDYGRINYVFTDWQKAAALQQEKYPKRRTAHKDLILTSEAETDKWVRSKIKAIKDNILKPESQLPRCSDEDLWRSDPKFKYFADPEKAKVPGARSTKNFDSLADASKFMNVDKGGKGTIVTVMGEPKRCAYCPAFQICQQRKEYFPDD